MTSRSVSNLAFYSASRASRDFLSAASVSTKWAFVASSFCLAAVTCLTARISVACAPVASAAQSWDSRQADSS